MRLFARTQKPRPPSASQPIKNRTHEENNRSNINRCNRRSGLSGSLFRRRERRARSDEGSARRGPDDNQRQSWQQRDRENREEDRERQNRLRSRGKQKRQGVEHRSRCQRQIPEAVRREQRKGREGREILNERWLSLLVFRQQRYAPSQHDHETNCYNIVSLNRLGLHVFSGRAQYGAYRRADRPQRKDERERRRL